MMSHCSVRSCCAQVQGNGNPSGRQWKVCNKIQVVNEKLKNYTLRKTLQQAQRTLKLRQTNQEPLELALLIAKVSFLPLACFERVFLKTMACITV